MIFREGERLSDILEFIGLMKIIICENIDKFTMFFDKKLKG